MRFLRRRADHPGGNLQPGVPSRGIAALQRSADIFLAENRRSCGEKHSEIISLVRPGERQAQTREETDRRKLQHRPIHIHIPLALRLQPGDRRPIGHRHPKLTDEVGHTKIESTVEYLGIEWMTPCR
jgi:hypothetical protein